MMKPLFDVVALARMTERVTSQTVDAWDTVFSQRRQRAHQERRFFGGMIVPWEDFDHINRRYGLWEDDDYLYVRSPEHKLRVMPMLNPEKFPV